MYFVKDCTTNEVNKNKEQMKKWILKNYPPIVLTIVALMVFVLMAGLLSAINYITTPDLPIQYQ